MDAIDALLSRKSCLNYKPDPLTDEQINILLKAANNAPKSGNFHITVIRNKNILKSISDKTLEIMRTSANIFLLEQASMPDYQPLYGAPLLLMFSAPEENPYSLAAVTGAATMACIAATALNIASCYVVTPVLAFTADDTLAHEIGIPEGYEALCGVLAGLPEPDKSPIQSQHIENINYRN